MGAPFSLMKTTLILVLALCAATVSSFCADTNSGPAAGSYQIRNRKYDALLRPENASNANGARIVLYPAEPWKCMTWKLQPAAGSAFHLQNYFTSKTFAVKSDDQEMAVVQVPFDRDTAKHPAWTITKLTDGFYRITDVKTGQALTGSKTAVTLAPWQEKPEQQWELMEIDPAKLTM
jgi:hypothetical protein